MRDWAFAPQSTLAELGANAERTAAPMLQAFGIADPTGIRFSLVRSGENSGPSTKLPKQLNFQTAR
jgi:hypothetical protein